MLALMLKLAIPCLHQPMKLLNLSKKIWDELAWTYGASSNIALIEDTFEKMFQLKGLEGAIEDIYASFRGFLIQLEVFQPFTLDVAS